MGVNY